MANLRNAIHPDAHPLMHTGVHLFAHGCAGCASTPPDDEES